MKVQTGLGINAMTDPSTSRSVQHSPSPSPESRLRAPQIPAVPPC